MSLDPTESAALAHVLGQTRDDEINCDEFLAEVGEFIEKKLAGEPTPPNLDRVAHHLSICPECQEEYEVLKLALEAIGPDA